jgi:hypothetical protein
VSEQKLNFMWDKRKFLKNLDFFIYRRSPKKSGPVILRLRTVINISRLWFDEGEGRNRIFDFFRRRRLLEPREWSDDVESSDRPRWRPTSTSSLRLLSSSPSSEPVSGIEIYEPPFRPQTSTYIDQPQLTKMDVCIFCCHLPMLIRQPNVAFCFMSGCMYILCLYSHNLPGQTFITIFRLTVNRYKYWLPELI